jgi:membrane associated rhomboid family serine protease
MLDDRDYMRQPEYNAPRWSPRFRFQWSWTFVLLAAYAIVFLAELVIGRFFPAQNFIFGYLALSKEGLAHGYAWQLVTYQFLHAGWLHILLNSWAIYMFGREVEAVLGGKKFLTLMLASGIVGGVFQVLVALVWPQYFGGPVVGASACAFGLVAVFALIFPERELTMLIFFVIPVQLRAKTLLIASAVLAVAGIVFPMDNVANAAHLGGMAMGWFYVRKILSGDWSRLKGALHPEEKFIPRRPPLEPLEKKFSAGFLESEADPILDKISAHGIQSLTPREREILETARQHIKRA